MTSDREGACRPDVSASIGFGQVRHARQGPSANAFQYPVCFLWLPMRTLRKAPDPALHRNRPALFGFRDRDHGLAGDDALAWLDDVLAHHGLSDLQGEVWLLTFPRVFGFVFKPVSFWFCHQTDGKLGAVLAEVNNTFGERHCYLLESVRFGQSCEAEKVFHVSPFCPVRGRYRFRFMSTPSGSPEGAAPRVVARIEYFSDVTAQDPVLVTSISGELMTLTASTRRRAIAAYPAMTAMVVARIHWQALKLWMRRSPFYRQPPAPDRAVTLVAAKSN